MIINLFSGTGTKMEAAMQKQRSCISIEKDPKQIGTIRKRISQRIVKVEDKPSKLAAEQIKDPHLKEIRDYIERGILPEDEKRIKYVQNISSQFVIEGGNLCHLWWPQRKDRRQDTRVQ